MRQYILLIIIAVSFTGCFSSKRLKYIKNNFSDNIISIPEESLADEYKPEEVSRDTMVTKDEKGHDVLIMNAVKNQDGEMVATDVIRAAMITARFRNIAERNGKVDISFDITVPQYMQYSNWQLRFYPTLKLLEDEFELKPVLITGDNYRKMQLRGYEQYEKFLNSIITDSTEFLYRKQLEVFLKRNIPEIYKYKNDTSFVSEEVFNSYYGISEKEAIEHYTNRFMIFINDHRISRKSRMYEKYIKSPIITDNIKLDTVLSGNDNDLIYRYIHTIKTQPGLKKAEVNMSGDIYENGKRIYTIPKPSSLTYYISSLSSLVDEKERYRTKIIERRIEENTACYIDFPVNSAIIDPVLGENISEIGRIKQNLRTLINNSEFEIDSITVQASCSPEGLLAHNKVLSMARSESVSEYFYKYINFFSDSLRKENGIILNMDNTYVPAENKSKNQDIRFIAKSHPENWELFSSLVNKDSLLSSEFKENFKHNILSIINLDMREERLRVYPEYKYLREKIYPRLRIVQFSFFMHRKGMVKDTIHTTVIDSSYSKGLTALRNREYETAVALLRPYKDFNTALAYCAMNYNESALEILNDIEKSASVNYMLSIIYGRKGDERKAVEYYMQACKQDNKYISRGNLDPEISGLIKKYGLNKEIFE